MNLSENSTFKYTSFEELEVYYRISELFKLFNKSNPEVQELLLNLFNVYYLGMVEDRLYLSYLHFWTVLEIATLSDKDTKHAEIIEILKSLFIKKHPLLFRHIDILYDIRNKLVHEGKYHLVSEHYRNSLKNNAEIMINFLIYELKKHNGDLGKIKLVYTYIQKYLKHLEDIKDTIDHIIKLKNSK